MSARRWRLWHCFQGPYNARMVDTREEIAWLESKGFKAKIWVPRPEHKTSGHTHIVVLCTFDELCKLAGIPIRPKISDKEKGAEIVVKDAVKIVNIHGCRRVFYGDLKNV